MGVVALDVADQRGGRRRCRPRRAVSRPEDGARTHRDRIAVPDSLLATLGSVSLVCGFTNAETHGRLAGQTLSLFVAALILLGAFVALESRHANPLLPLRVVIDRNRAAPTSPSA